MMVKVGGSQARLAKYMAGLSEVVGRAGRGEQLQEYCSGLLMPLERKSVEPIAAMTAPTECSAKHQSLLHFVGQSPWLDDAVLAKVQAMVLPVIERHGSIRAWIIDDTGLPKKGRHSVGVKRQYCGQLGKTANCQVAVSLSVASDTASLPIAYRLFLPQDWADDDERRAKTGVPDDITFQTKGEIALEQIKGNCSDKPWTGDVDLLISPVIDAQLSRGLVTRAAMRYGREHGSSRRRLGRSSG